MSRVSVFEVLAFVWRYWRRLPIRLTLIVIGVALAVYLEILIPDRAAQLMSAVESAVRDAGAAKPALDPAWNALFQLVGIYLALLVVNQFYLRLWMYFASEVMQQLVLDGFERIQRFSADWHTNHFAGSTVRKVTRGMWAYDSLADTIVVELGPPFALLVGFSVAMFLRHPVLGLYFGAIVVAFVASSFVMSLAYVAPANVRSNDADTELGGALADAITCNAVVKSFGAEAREDDQMVDVTWSWRRLSRRAWTRSVDAGAIQTLLLTAMLAILLAAALDLVAQGKAGLPDVVYVLTTYFLVRVYLRNIGWQIRNFQRAVNELDDLVEFANTPPQVADAPGASRFVPGAGEIVFDRVGFRYRNQPQDTFSELSVRIAAGERVALVGESGAGKTTFVKLLQRLYDLDRGEIRVDGQDIAACQQSSLRQQLSLVPQEPILFHRSLEENIGYGRPGASREEIIDAARRAHAHDFIMRLDQGYETLVGERGIKLSGGERQRVAIARAILCDAPVLLFDEATSSLDSLTEQLIQDAIRTLIEGRTAILIAHRLSTIRQVDRILVFDRGEIVEEGTHDELMAEPGGHYRRMFDMQTLGFVDDIAETSQAS